MKKVLVMVAWAVWFGAGNTCAGSHTCQSSGLAFVPRRSDPRGPRGLPPSCARLDARAGHGVDGRRPQLDAFNAGRLFTDSARIYQAGSALPAAQFLTRWITHLCAPTFLFLAGTSLAFTASRMMAAGDRARDIDRYLLIRGLVIALFELWISFTVIGHGRFVLQVLYGIGTAYMLMVPLRRLPDCAAPLVALGFIATSELLVRGALARVADSWPVALLLTGGFRGRVIVAYPTLHWLAILLLGWSWGRRLVTAPASRETAARDAARAGLAALAVFVALRRRTATATCSCCANRRRWSSGCTSASTRRRSRTTRSNWA